MKTVGESIRDFAIHRASILRDLPGIELPMIKYEASESDERAAVLYELFDALDASERDSSMRLNGTIISWQHSPVEGEAYEVGVVVR